MKDLFHQQVLMIPLLLDGRLSAVCCRQSSIFNWQTHLQYRNSCHSVLDDNLLDLLQMRYPRFLCTFATLAFHNSGFWVDGFSARKLQHICRSFSSSSLSGKKIQKKSSIAMSASALNSSAADDPSSNDNNNNNNNSDTMITILGFGSLLSERSSRTTFPDLQNFRLGRVPNYRRVFRHPASIFFQRGIANFDTKEMSSLCAEPCDEEDDDAGFVCSIFEVPNDDMMKDDGIPSAAFLEREEEFDIIQVPYIDLSTKAATTDIDNAAMPMGILCTSSTDDVYFQRWGKERFDEYYGKYGIDTIWGWEPDSGLRPCAVYLRHCYLAAKGMGEVCFDSFLDETFLVDRTTTVREYIQKYPEILDTSPPPALVGRYSG